VKSIDPAYERGVQIYRIILLSATLLVAGVGCQSSIKQTQTDAPTAAPLLVNSRVYVAMPEDGLDKKGPVPDSGRRMALALQDAFKKHTRNVLMGRTPETLEQAIGHAREFEYEFVAMPTILKWEDRPTEWTGVRDKLQVKVDLVSVQTGEILRSTMIDGKGRWMTDGDDQPQDMLAEPVDKFVRAMFRITYTPTALQ
jgi:hypothetical protein